MKQTLNQIRTKVNKIIKPPYSTKDMTILGFFVLVVIVFPVVAYVTSQRQNENSMAAETSQFEPENGTLSGNVTVVSDSNAVNGKYVQFGAAVPTPTPTGPQLYVTATGTGTACTQAAPCSFSSANTKATPGTTVHVAPGSYGSVTTSTPGTAAAHIHWLSDTKWGAKMSGDAASTVEISGSYIDFEGFDVTGGKDTQNLIEVGIYSAAIGNYVHDSPRGCTYNGGIETNTHALVIGNLIKNIGQGTPGKCNEFHGIYNDSYDVIENNVIVNVPNGSGIQSWHNTTHVTIINNTVMGAGADGILVGSDTGSNTGGYIANNISVNNHRNGLSETGTAAGNTWVDNLSFGNGASAASLSKSSTNTGMIQADPLFVNPTTGDYHLKAGSPAINKGASAQAPATDFDGITRPQGAGFDIGAFEFH